MNHYRRILVCGSRNWGTAGSDRQIDFDSLEFKILKAALDGLLNDFEANVSADDKLVLIEGAATGADSMAGWWADRRGGVEHLAFPANWDEYGRAAGPIRNKQMLDEGRPDLVIACSNDLENSRGTANMVKQSTKAGLPVLFLSVLNNPQPSLFS